MQNKRFLLIGIDGVGKFIEDANTPNIDRIFKNGNVTYNAQTVFPSISAPCWASMLYGVTPEKHDKHNGTIDHIPHPVDSEYPSIFRVIRETHKDAELAAFCTYKDLHIGVIEDGIGVHKVTYDSDLAAGLEGKERFEKLNEEQEPNLTDKLLSYLDDHDPYFTFFSMGSTDTVGHYNGYGSPAHLKQLEKLDVCIGRLWDKLEALGRTDDLFVLLTTDHGGTPLSAYGSATHGGLSKNEMTITMAVRGNGVINGEMKDAKVIDVPTIFYHAMGIDIPENQMGIVPDNLFEGYEFKPRKDKEIVFDVDKTKVELPECDSIKNYFPFKEDFYDYKGNVIVKPKEKYYFTRLGDGLGLDIEDGYIRFENLKFSEASFSLAFRAEIHSLDKECMMFSNVDSLSREYGTYVWWGGQTYNGFQIAMNKDGFRILIWGDGIGDGPQNTDSHWHYNTEQDISVDLSKGKTADIIFSVDRENNKAEFYLDFECLASFDLHEDFKKYQNTLQGGMLTFGNDITGEFPVALRDVNPRAPMTISDLFVFDKAMDEESLSMLKKFFGK